MPFGGARRTVMRQKFLMSAVLLAAAPALAQDLPLILPERDVAVEYQSSGMVPGPAGMLSTTVLVRFARDMSRLRIDGPYGGFYAIVDINADRMFVVMPNQRIYADQPADPNFMALFDAGGAQFTRIGTGTVAGLPCTAYDATVNDRAGRVCLTDDGVLLSARIADPDRHPELEAIRVTYARQPQGMFEIPRGFRRFDVPNLPGLNLGPPGDGRRGDWLPR
jgi:hypothetical protein